MQQTSYSRLQVSNGIATNMIGGKYETLFHTLNTFHPMFISAVIVYNHYTFTTPHQTISATLI